MVETGAEGENKITCKSGLECLQGIINSVDGFYQLVNKLRNIEYESENGKQKVHNDRVTLDYKKIYRENSDEIEKYIKEELKKLCKMCFNKSSNKNNNRGKKNSKDCCYGVYIIWCVINEGNQSPVLYIGKGGTITGEGTYKDQGVCKRLREAPRGDDKKSIDWFKTLLKKYKKIEVEIFCFDYYNNNTSDGEETGNEERRPKLFLPAFVEALLLQYYYWEVGELPCENKGF